MRTQFVEAMGIAVVVAVVIGLWKLTQISVAGQSPTTKTGSAAESGPVPKTRWGHPDLQGIWTSERFVPLQRPQKFAGRAFLTDAEVADLDKARAAFPTFSVRSKPRGTEHDVAGAYGDDFQSIRRTGRRTSLIVAPRDGRIPPLTAETQRTRRESDEYRVALLQAASVCKNGEKDTPNCAGVRYTGATSPRRAEVPPHYLMTAINRADGPEDRGLSERCMAAGLPDLGGYRRVVQSRESVSIFYDVGQGQGRVRVIPITTAPHLPPTLRQWFGDSRGHWEGETLVVDVTNFLATREFQGARENLHLIERWTRLDASTLEYVVTIEDPATWTRPWTVQQELNKQNDQQNRIYYEPRCHEGNYAMPTMLLGARLDDKAYAEGRGPNPATKCYIVCLPGVDEENPLR
jgi:hypothetical protein